MMTGKNIGDLLNAAHITWGIFMGGFNLHTINANGTTGCSRTHLSAQSSTAPSSTTSRTTLVPVLRVDRQPDPCASEPRSQAIGYTMSSNGKVDPANHDYDLKTSMTRSRPAISRRSPSSRCRLTRTVTPATPIRSMSRPAMSS